MTRKQFKFVVVGDGSCGKTSLIIAQAGGEFTEEYTPTAFDDYAIEALVNGKTVHGNKSHFYLKFFIDQFQKLYINSII